MPVFELEPLHIHSLMNLVEIDKQPLDSQKESYYDQSVVEVMLLQFDSLRVLVIPLLYENATTPHQLEV
jgi:hypothetical protein